MEELKLLVEMVANLPSMALWVIAFFFAYKVSIIGSIYGVIRLAIQRWYEWGVSDKSIPPLEIIRQEIHFEDILNGIAISGDETKVKLIVLLKNIAANNPHYKSQYIHSGTVDWMQTAIENQRKLEAKDKK